MPVEQLARKHLGADLTRMEFWEEAMKPSLEDVRLFLKLTEGR